MSKVFDYLMRDTEYTQIDACVPVGDICTRILKMFDYHVRTTSYKIKRVIVATRTCVVENQVFGNRFLEYVPP